MAAMAPKPPLPPALLLGSDLTLIRGGRTLFSGLTVHLSAGDVLAVEGPNGAGKSSLLLTLAGVLYAERGSVTTEVGEAPDLHFLGYGSAVKTRLTVAENLTFWRTMYGPTGIGVPEALERVGLAHTAALDAGVLSAGQTRRLGLARLLVSKRAVWLLDEPTASLDTAGNLLVQDMIDEHAKAGGAAIVATHDPLAITHRVLKLGGAP
jgi:heme exporter protein A